MTRNKILVTGGTGFTGGHLCRKLAEQGHAVRALVRSPEQAADLATLGIELVPGDLRDLDSVRQAMNSIDVVYHIAALFRRGNATRHDMWEVNVLGTRNMLEAAVEANIKRFVHCSTIGVHGDVKNPPATETSPYNPGDNYQDTKLQGEKIAQKFMSEGRIPISIFRPAGIYGPRDLRFLKLIKSISQGTFVMIGSGDIMYHMIYIEDLVNGILLCGTKDEAVGNIYILAGSETVTLNQLVRYIAEVTNSRPPTIHIPFAPVYLAGYLCEIICKPLGLRPPLFRRRVDFFRKTRWFDISKARHELGFDPSVDVKTGLKHTVAWYRQEGLL